MAVGHTIKSFDADLEQLRSMITQMGGIVESQLTESIAALVGRDSDHAARVAEGDKKLDRLEVETERMAVQIIARRHPVADDLRDIIAALKISSMLERIGDYAKNIAKRTSVLAQSPPLRPIGVIQQMGDEAERMIRDVLDAYVNADSERAVDVWERDQRVDNLYNSLFRELLTYMMENPQLITPCTHLLFIAKNVERVGDQATNIAELIYFAAEGNMLEEIYKRPKRDDTAFMGISRMTPPPFSVEQDDP